MNATLGSIFQTLDMGTNNGLINIGSESTSAFQRYFFNQVKEKMGLEAVFFLRDADDIPKIPLIYFSAMDTYDPKKIAELHRLAWNTGEAPLLFIVTPDQLLIYNNYDPPRYRDDGEYDEQAGLFEQISLVSELEAQRKLLQYHRTKIETGEFWQRNIKRFDAKTRVDATLMSNLKVIRKTLLNNMKNRTSCKEIDNQSLSKIVHALLGRSILIKYLEERTDSKGNSVFPLDFFGSFNSGATQYTDVLTNKAATYSLFHELEKRFHGDMFPIIDQEFDVITQYDLEELRLFILGESELASGQIVMWPLYSFNIIPIQLISSIYELFFHLAEVDPDKEHGTYYTPFHLVEMLMDEVFPWDGAYIPQKILDPSCGSGIFLVEAYRRLIGRWMYSNQSEMIGSDDLINILQSCIFGIDCNEEAVRIASFSLSLAMCDFLEPRMIWNDLKFPNLLQKNLFPDDFFERQKVWESKEFDIVIGNPPWESKLSSYADKYVEETKCIVGDKQIAQAFTWRAIDVCHDGVVCFLLPSKGFLFNRSTTTKEYRKQFFERHDVSVIINYSVFRKEKLFEHATGPASGVIYRARKSDERDVIFYCTPKPLYTIEDRRRFLIEPNDICRIPVELSRDDLIWKIAMWGGPRDMDLIHSIQSMHKNLRDILSEYEMVHAEGFIKGNGKNTCNDFVGWPFLEPKTFTPGQNTVDSLKRVDFNGFYRMAKKNQAIFNAPHLLIKQSHKGSRFLADVLDFDALFSQSFYGVHGNENILKYLCLMISSKVSTYYHLMTSRRWLIERDELNAADILDTPIPVPTACGIEEAGELFELVFRKGENIGAVDEFAYRQYGLRPHEISLVKDAIECVYDYFSKKGKSVALKPPAEKMLYKYMEVLFDVLKNSLGTELAISSCIYHGDTPLLIVALDLTLLRGTKFTINKNTQEMDELLEKLDKQLLEMRSGSVFVKRNVRIYNNDHIFIVKPNQMRYWNYTAACRDADEIYADTMRTWRDENEQN